MLDSYHQCGPNLLLTGRTIAGLAAGLKVLRSLLWMSSSRALHSDLDRGAESFYPFLQTSHQAALYIARRLLHTFLDLIGFLCGQATPLTDNRLPA